MPFDTITNINNYVYTINSNNIFAITVQPGSSGRKTTHIYGLLNVPLESADAPQIVLDRYNLKKRFVQFTGYYGELWIRGDAVSVFHTPNAGDHLNPASEKFRCIVFAGGTPFKVNEEIQTVQKRLEEVLGTAKPMMESTITIAAAPKPSRARRRPVKRKDKTKSR